MRPLLLPFLMVFLIGCSLDGKPIPEQQAQTTLFNSQYGFSFSYPSSWVQVTKDLPQQWAIVQGSDTIIFTVNDVQSEDLLTLGRTQALRDLNANNSAEKMVAAVQIVGLAEFGKKQWYTYAIEFSDKDINSIISGTVCNGKEVNMVLVSSIPLYEFNKGIYVTLLESFTC